MLKFELPILFLILVHIHGFTLVSKNEDAETFPGVYQSGREFLSIQPGNSFWIKRVAAKNDVAVLECNDTIAKGTWKKVANGVVKLANSDDFGKILYEVKQEKRFSADSVYIEICLPKDDSFIEGRIEYNLFFWHGIGAFRSYKSVIVLPKDKAAGDGTCNFSLSIKDALPHCGLGEKCYQRIYFRVFDDLNCKEGNNYFTINLKNFTECFVEKMDMDNEVLLADKNRIYWRGKVYQKVNGPTS